jgi:competence protein ComEA
MKDLLKEYFNLSKKESIAAILLICLIFVTIFAPYFFKRYALQKPFDPQLRALAQQAILLNDSLLAIDSLEYKIKNYGNYNKYAQNTEHYTLNPFRFDPNTIEEIGLNKLGLPKKFIKTFLNFRNKGAKFYKPEDFKRVWGLKEEDANFLLPYIVIANSKKNNWNEDFKYFKKANNPTIIDINIAGVNEFRQLPGVGNLAYKIVKYRDKLGGFLTINQVKETYEITDSIFNAIQPFLTLQNPVITKININTATDFELASHPYIEKNIAKAIVIYRNQHGNYKQVADLKKIIFIKKEWVDKMAPYLTVD